MEIIDTPIGPAILWDMQSPIEIPRGHGLITFGRWDRALYAQKILSLPANWIADYSPKIKMAIVVSPGEYQDWRFPIELPAQKTICPNCGCSEASTRGINWQCKECKHQYRKVPGKRGGARRVVEYEKKTKGVSIRI